MADGIGIEYRIVSGKPEAVENQINDLAAAGWVVDQVTNASGGMGNFALFGLAAVVTIVLRRVGFQWRAFTTGPVITNVSWIERRYLIGNST